MYGQISFLFLSIFATELSANRLFTSESAPMSTLPFSCENTLIRFHIMMLLHQRISMADTGELMRL